MKTQSEKFTLNRADANNWFDNLKIFIAPVIVIYLISVIALISADGHTLALSDFIPNEFTRTSGVVYVLNSLLDIFRKFVA